MTRAAITILFLMLVATQPGRSQSNEDEPIKVSTILANVPVIVSDRTGKHVAGIKAEDFKITSDDTPKEIVYFSNFEMPLNVAIVTGHNWQCQRSVGRDQESREGIHQSTRTG